MSKDNIASAAKGGLIYTVSNILIRGMAFYTTPIFTRLMSKGEYGNFSNISSWANIISIVVTLQLYTSLIRAKYDYDDDINRYIASILLLGNVITLVWWGIVELNMQFFESFLAMDSFYIRIIFVYSLLSPAMLTLIYKSRIYSEYKTVVIYTCTNVVISIGGSALLVWLMEDKLVARTVGNYLLILVLDIALWFYIILRGKGIKLHYWKYALRFSLPLLPHEIAGQILIFSDQIIIKRLCGAEDAALYSLAYTIATIATILLMSMNQSWQPWMMDRIAEGKIDEIYEYSVWYTLIFAFGCTGIMLFGPEVIAIMGNGTYDNAKYVIPPVCFAIMLQFIYTLYANIEYYKKETIWISIATVISACVNVVLNFLLIPKFGYIAAAYTTVVGFAVMVLIHYLVVRFKTDLVGIYNLKVLLMIVAVSFGTMILSLILYTAANVIRYICILIYLLVLAGAAWAKKDVFKSIISKGKK